MLYLVQRLPKKARRGSKPRCHFLTHGSPGLVSTRLTELIAPWGKVTPNDRWMPGGFKDIREARFGKDDIILDKKIGQVLVEWWLAVPGGANIPNWDIASTCQIEGRQGVLLVEAKAHVQELTGADAGKTVRKDASENSRKNDARIRSCIGQANELLRRETGLDWRLSAEQYYQMSNRFAWACKLADIGIPVILLYLGFLNADDLKGAEIAFHDASEWRSLVMKHSLALFPDGVWGTGFAIKNQPLIALIDSKKVDLRK
jgi:hypothetical protein